MTGTAPGPRAIRVRAVAAAGLCGFSCMAAELTAVRLLAPSFGDSAYVWTNVIGVILAALAGGAWIGGRLSLRAAPLRLAATLLLAGAVLVAVAPFVGPPLGRWLLPPDLPLDAAMPALVRGSFVASALLFGPAMVLLGAISPLLVTAVVRAGRDVGGAAGAIAAMGTIGSLAGTFLATHWLVPGLGCRVALLVCGLALVVAAMIVATGRGRAVGGAALLLLAGSGAGHDGPLRPPHGGRELLAEVESRSQFLQVLRERGADGVGRTRLVINEGLDSFHSLAVDGTVFTGGAYYDWHALAPFLVAGGRPDPLRALSIGDAAGTLRTIYAAVHPGALVDAVDIDPATMTLGDAWFPGHKAGGQRFVLDGRVFLERAVGRWHVIHVDAYAHQIYVPAHLASREFFAAARDRLQPGGVLACNVGALHRDDPVLRAVGTTMAAVFGHALALPIRDTRNALLVARAGAPPDPAALAGAASAPTRLGTADLAHWQAVVQAASSPRAWADAGAGGALLHDDRPQLDQLLARSYVERQDAGEMQACRGDLEPAGAEAAAFAAARERDWLGVLAAVASSRAPTAYLREQAGNANWGLRRLRTALAEYDAARGLATEPTAQTRIDGNRAAVAAELVPIVAAERTAARNGWLQFVVVAAAAGSAWWLWRSGA